MWTWTCALQKETKVMFEAIILHSSTFGKILKTSAPSCREACNTLHSQLLYGSHFLSMKKSHLLLYFHFNAVCICFIGSFWAWSDCLYVLVGSFLHFSIAQVMPQWPTLHDWRSGLVCMLSFQELKLWLYACLFHWIGVLKWSTKLVNNLVLAPMVSGVCEHWHCLRWVRVWVK